MISNSTRFPCRVSLAPCVHPTRRPSRLRTMPFNVQLQDRTTLYLLTFLEFARYVVLVLTWWVFTPSASPLAFRVAACSTTLRQGLEKIQTARGHNCAPIFALSPEWEKEFLAPSMACSTASAFDIVCRLYRANLMKLRASKVLGPISRCRVADILLHMKLVSRASRPGLTVGILRILCNGLCTALRFHPEEHDHTCRVGCPNEPDSLSH